MATKLLEPFEKSLASLVTIFVTQPDSDVLRDAIILRFQYTIEIAWKTSKKILEDQGVTADSPKNVMRELAKMNLIEDAEPWIDFVNARNLIPYTYDRSTAEEIFGKIHLFVTKASNLLSNLRKVDA